MMESLMDMARYLGAELRRVEAHMLPAGRQWMFAPGGVILVIPELWDQLQVDFKEVELLTEVLEERRCG